MTQKSLRKFSKIPIFIVEDHNEVLEFIYRCLGSLHMPFQNNKIIHFDSHPDMTIPRYMPAEFVTQKDKLLDALSIENWLMPTVYAGHFNQLIWMKPPWAHQIEAGDYHFFVGDHCGFIRCDSHLEYFLGEGSYRPNSDLNNAKPVNLNVFTLDETLITDVEHSNQRTVSFIDCANESEVKFVLDIDLDFFSTHNPFLSAIDHHKIYEGLKRIFKADFFTMKFDASSKSTELLEFVTRRLQYLDDLEAIFKRLDEGTSIDQLTQPDSLANVWSELIELLHEIEIRYSNGTPMNWMLFYDAGCTFDSTELPHHESTDNQIDELIELLRKFLTKFKLRPILVTISRSSDDDYCPKHQVERIQAAVLSVLKEVYGDEISDKPILHYKNEEWAV